MEPINPQTFRYIKLGRGGAWAQSCFAEGQIQFGYRAAPHEVCQRGDWDAIHRLLVEAGRSPAKASDGVREIRDFYSLGADCLWITFADGRLWWALAQPEVIWSGASNDGGSGPRFRRTIGGWRNESIHGEPLRIDQLNSKLTQVAAYRQTICRVKVEAYLVRRINGIEEPIVARARELRSDMAAVAAEMIADLHWADFETLVDLIFARSGWQRVSRVGGEQADTDLVLEQPTTGERAFVQVKSKAGQAVLDDYVGRYWRASGYDRFFFVCHSPKTELATDSDPRLHVWAGERLADATVQAGLFDWLVERSR
jgi:hypothetical protein